MPARRFRRIASFVALLTLGSGLAACQGGTGRSSVSQLKRDLEPISTVLGGASIFNLPPIPIDVDTNGRIARIGGFQSQQIDELWQHVTGNPLVGRVRFFASDEDGASYTSWFARAGVRQITVASRRNGLYVLVNGRPLPYIAWSAREIDNMLALLDRLAVDDDGAQLLSKDQRDMLADLAPLLQSVPLQLDFNFPAPKGAARAPRPGSPDADAFIVDLTESERQTVPQQTIDFDLDYEPRAKDQSWVPSWLGFSTEDLRTLLAPADVQPPLLRLRRDLQARLARASVEDAEVQMTNSGLYVIVDGKPLPHIGWNEASLSNLVTALNQLYPDDEPRTRDNAWVDIVRSTAPLYNDVSLGLRVHFPGSEHARAAASAVPTDVPTPAPTRTRRPRPSTTPRPTATERATDIARPAAAPTRRVIDVDATLTAVPVGATPRATTASGKRLP
ncbi:MAG: hypothetical protein ABI780_07655 [Ardenticatenales bacterium]